MRSAPRLLALRVEGEPLRNLVELLGDEDELQRRAVNTLYIAVLLLDSLLENIQKILPDYIDNLAETGLNGVINRIVDYGFIVGTEPVHLLESAVAAAHTGSENQKSRFHICE